MHNCKSRLIQWHLSAFSTKPSFLFLPPFTQFTSKLTVSAVWELLPQPCSFGLVNEQSVLRKEAWNHTISYYIQIKFVKATLIMGFPNY